MTDSPGGDFDREGPATGAESFGGGVCLAGAEGGVGTGVADGVRAGVESGAGAEATTAREAAEPVLFSTYV